MPFDPAYPDLQSVVVSAIESHPYASTLERTPRWSKFRTHESDDFWRESHAGNGFVLEHMLTFTERSYDMLVQEGIHPDDHRRIYLGMLTHDIGETMIDQSGVGDIAAPLKNAEHEAVEREIAHTIISELDVPPSLREELHDAYRFVTSRESEAFDFFRACERYDYLYTAMNQARKHVTGESIELAPSLIGRVLGYDLRNVITLSEVYPESIGARLASERRTIDRMFEIAAPDPDIRMNYAGQFGLARESWHYWLKTIGEEESRSG